ncbi:MAG: FliM/FliN family flagellar motor switch protein [Planctomycetes bacterium]|jgi:flagellar motor switch/type III secretory pathway protein FliN|nr:FliM/FliN family flagellar motor switch protein [Planctomycetota bacterium]
MTQMRKPNTMAGTQLLELMQRMRSLVEPDTHIPDADPVDWHVPHRLNRTSREELMLFSVKLAGHLEKCLHTLSGMPFEVRAEGVYERYADQLHAHVVQKQPQTYYLPVTQSNKGHAGFISLPFETAALLVGCMLRDPDSQIGQNGQMTSLAESILQDAASSLAEALAAGFEEYGCTPIQKSTQIIYRDWPVVFHDVDDVCEFRFEAVSGQAKLTISLTVLDEVIADIARIEGPFKRAEDKKGDPEQVVRQMHEAPLRVTALLSSALMTLKDILALEEGDVVILDRKITEPVDILVNERPCFCGWPARHGKRLALLIAGEKNQTL